jgi:MFS family permease
VPYGDYTLTPAYDLLSTRLHMPEEARTAQALFKDEFETDSYQANAFFAYDNFHELAMRLGLIERRFRFIMQAFLDKERVVVSLIDRSGLSEECKPLNGPGFATSFQRVTSVLARPPWKRITAKREAMSTHSEPTNGASGPDRSDAIDTDIPARLDRLPWSRFHWLLVIALGVTWVLDGLEATIVGAVGPMLMRPSTLGLRADQIGLAHTTYLAGAILGALLFGHLADRLGRKKLFNVTLLIYMAGAVLSAFAWDFWSFLLFRFITGMAIGGEYSAINSAIDELIPARVRGRVDLAINGTFWLGAIIGASATVVLLDEHILPVWLGWRISFGLGGLVGFGMLLARHYVPESPRWLLIHGRRDEAEAIMRQIESHVAEPEKLPPVTQRMTIYPGTHIGFGLIARTLFVRYRSRAFLGLVLVASQAFFYNGVSTSYPLVIHQYYGVPADRTGLYVVVMAVANLLGPLLLGSLFDSVGRRVMISSSYALAGLIIIGSEVFFLQGQLTASSQTLLWAVAFFFASAAASAGYLTVSEIFPLEMRALAIALFFAVATAIGGLGAPLLFGEMTQRFQETGDKWPLAYGYFIGAGLMIFAAAVELWLGVDTEGKALEDVAAPLRSEGPAPHSAGVPGASRMTASAPQV